MKIGMKLLQILKDSFSEETDYWDTMIALKRINAADVTRVVRKLDWTSGTTYEMYRNDYSRSNVSPVTSSTNLYDANYYVMNSDYRVYVVCKMAQTQKTQMEDHLLTNHFSQI